MQPEIKSQRSQSNHKCCYNSRYRSRQTRHITESTPSSNSSPRSSRRKRDFTSSDSKNDSSGYGCSRSKISRTEHHSKRRRASSHVKQHKGERSCADASKTGKTGSQIRSTRQVNGEHSRPFDSVRDTNDTAHESRQRRSRSGDDQVDYCDHRAVGRNGHASSSRHSHRSLRQPRADINEQRDERGSGHRERKRRAERDRRERSHARHRRKQSPALSSEDAHGRHNGDRKNLSLSDDTRSCEKAIVPIGDVIKGRYSVEAILGEGSYGQVLRCCDLHTRKVVAVKALKRSPDDKESAAHEVGLMDKLAKLDTAGRSHCVGIIDFFNWHNKYFIALPLLGSSVFQFLETNNFVPYPVHQVAHITLQLCEAIQFLHKHEISHTDIKPENILFVDDTFDDVFSAKANRAVRVVQDSTIKVIDFGSATYDKDHHSTTIQTRHYRAPEVVLELGWSYPADVWSVGCIVHELITGECLFMTHDNLQHLAMMERFLGPVPRHMLKKSRCRRYVHRGKLDWDVENSDGRYVRRHVKPLADLWFDTSNLCRRLAFDLVKEMLYFDPFDRITPSKALEHPFLLSFANASM